MKSKIYLVVLVPFVVFLFWQIFLRDPSDIRHIQEVLAKLETQNIASVSVGHQVIDKPKDIESIVSSFHKCSALLKPAQSANGVVLTINRCKGRPIECRVNKLVDAPSDALLDFAFSPGNARTLQISVPQLADILKASGAPLPEPERVRVSEATGAIESPLATSSKSDHAALHTLYNIEKSRALQGDEVNTGYVVACIVLALLALIYGAVGCNELAAVKRARAQGEKSDWGWCINRFALLCIFGALSFFCGHETVAYAKE